ncbi:MAG TPA: protein kinase [Kofleriaceae bacterium]
MVDVGGAPIDRYVVLEHLSEGGMGAIYVGKKLGAGGFEMEVVLKQLLPEFTQQEEFIDLFLREAKLSATLDHANIVHTIDLVTAGGEYFIVMEYLPGGDLRTLIKKAKRRGKRFSPAASIRICREVCSALAYAHVKRDFDGQPLRLIHRDVSPSNILVSYTGEVKLTDFGIAKASTHTSNFYKVKGKIGYMSPEQAKSERLDHRSDLYSLAVCMYEILTGERLFVHAGLTTSAEEIYSQPVPSLLKKIPGLPPELDAIMRKALAINPDDRYQTAGELNEALTRCAHRNGLLMAAPELSRELLEICGPYDAWRGEEEDEDLGYAMNQRAGTEVYDSADDEDEEEQDDDDEEPLEINALALARSKRQSVQPVNGRGDKSAPRPKTEIDKFAGVELTSIINVMDLEEQGTAATPPRARPGATRPPPLPATRLPGVPSTRPPAPPTAPPPPRPQAADVSELYPTKPRSMPSPDQPMPPGEGVRHASVPPRDAIAAAPRAPAPYVQPGQSGNIPQQPLRQRAPSVPQTERMSTRDGAQRMQKRSVIKPWMVILLVLVAAGVAGVIIALSGPSV